MAKQPAKPDEDDEHARFEELTKRLLAVPKEELDEALRREQNGNGRSSKSPKK